ncbi:MAG: DUF3179 domain-containing protein [Acidobacteria bacterium]|nr:MAG: DUF3179 domain-containing protein [Acidobacteriota bacterium]
MYARRIGQRTLTFDFGEGLVNDNLLVVDRETSSVWSQLDGGAISGPLAGTPLPVVPSVQATWRFWRHRHPETRVWVPEDGDGRPYLYRNRRPGKRRPKTRPVEHDVAVLGLGLAFGDEAVFFPFRALERAARRGRLPLRLSIGGQEVVVHYDGEGLTAWAEDPQGNLLPGVLAYRFGWLDFHPESSIYKGRGHRRR